MAESIGREITLTLGGSVVMCFRTLTMTHNGEQLDMTDSCSDGYRVLSTKGPGERSLDFQVEGVAKEAFLRNLMLGGATGYLEDAVLSLADGSTVTLDVAVSAYSEGITYNELTTFSATLQSSGPWVYAP